MGGIYWLASYPKSGNTWMRSFIANLVADGEAPVDINELETGAIASSRGWLDDVLCFDTADLFHHEVDELRPVAYGWSMQNPEPGYHKIHDAYTFTASGEPMVSREVILGALYIIRNPLDVVSSAAHHWHLDLDATIDRMGRDDMALARGEKGLSDQVRQRLLSWSSHVLSWVDAPGLNLQVVRYEDMLAHPHETFSQAVRLLRLPDEPERIAKALRFSRFEVLAEQEATKGFKERSPKASKFFREGISGGWRKALSDAQIERIIADHGPVMRRFGYLDEAGRPG